MRREIYQIFYDDCSREKVHPNFIPLDNTHGPSDWYEFYPMLNTLRATKLEEDVWYGFLSPNFFEKSGINYLEFDALLERHANFDVGLFSSVWPDLALYLNTWEQGDLHHPGLKKYFDDFITFSNRDPLPEPTVSDFNTSVFSNYVVGKKKFWLDWLRIAEEFLLFSERAQDRDNFETYTKYRGRDEPMKVFAQERLCNYLFLQNRYRSFHLDYKGIHPWPSEVAPSSLRKRWLSNALCSCNLSKRKYLKTGNTCHIYIYRIKRIIFWQLYNCMATFCGRGV